MRYGMRLISSARSAAKTAAFFLVAATVTPNASAVNRTWGGGSDFQGTSWSRAENWTDDTVPGSGDVAVFGGTQSADCDIDATVNVGGLIIDAAYGGTITQTAAYNITVGSSHFEQDGGAFVGGSGNFTVNHPGEFRLSGGAFTAPAGFLTANLHFIVTGGTFDANNGTVRMTDSGNTKTSTLNAEGVTLHHFWFDSPGNRGMWVTNQCTVAGDVFVRASNPSYHAEVNARTGARITLLGNLTKTNSTMNFAVPLLLTNSVDQTLGAWGGGITGALTVDKPAGTVHVIGTTSSGGALTILNGAVVESIATVNRGALMMTNSASYTLTNSATATFTYPSTVNSALYGDATLTSIGTRDITFAGSNSGFLFLTNNASMTLEAGSLTVGYLDNHATLDLGDSSFVITDGQTTPLRTGGTVFNDFTYQCRGHRTMTVMDDFTVLGDMKIAANNETWAANVSPSGTRVITLHGNFVQTNSNPSTFGNANLTLKLAGTNRQALARYSGSVACRIMTTGEADAALATVFNANRLTIEPGASFDLNGHNLTLSANVLTVDGALRLQGGETTSTPTLNAGSTVRYDGAAAPVTIKAWPYRGLHIEAAGRQFDWTAGEAYTVAEALTLQGAAPPDRLRLRSTVPGTQWMLTLDPAATQSVWRVDVSDSDASGGQTIDARGSLGADANNLNWRFGGGSIILVR